MRETVTKLLSMNKDETTGIMGQGKEKTHRHSGTLNLVLHFG